MLSYVSKERLEQSVKEEVLPTLDFTYFATILIVLKENKWKVLRKMPIEVQDAWNNTYRYLWTILSFCYKWKKIFYDLMAISF